MDGEYEVNGDKRNLHIPPISSVTPFFDWSLTELAGMNMISSVEAILSTCGRLFLHVYKANIVGWVIR